MKQPYFPEPPPAKDDSPYRESPREPDEPLPLPKAIVVSRPEPLPEESRAPKVTRAEARALLAVQQNQRRQHVRARILVAPVTLLLWRYGHSLGVARWVVYPLLAVSLVILGLEIKRIWRRTQL